MGEGTEAQIAQITCSKLHSHAAAQLSQEHQPASLSQTASTTHSPSPAHMGGLREAGG